MAGECVIARPDHRFQNAILGFSRSEVTEMSKSDWLVPLVRLIGLIIIASFWAWSFFPSDKRVKQVQKSWMDQGYVVQDYSGGLKKPKPGL